MARKKTIKVKGKEASLAYITEEEKKLLLARDKAKGSIAEKFHKGIPVLFAGEGDPDAFGEPGTGEVGDGLGHVDMGDIESDAPEATVGEGDSDADRIACERAGGTWENGVCVMPTDGDGDSDGDGDGDEDIDETWEKADPYAVSSEGSRLGKPPSETRRTEDKLWRGTPFAESVVETMMGERKGLGAKSEELARIGMDRDAMEAQLAAAQEWASKGMSFSTSHLNSEEEMIRNLSRDRLMSAAEGQELQTKFDLDAWNNSEAIQKLAAASRLTDMQGTPFKTGAIDIGELMEPNFGITPPGFSGLPENMSKIFKDYASNPLYQLAENITDPAGNVCDYNELDEAGYCPVIA